MTTNKERNSSSNKGTKKSSSTRTGTSSTSRYPSRRQSLLTRNSLRGSMNFNMLMPGGGDNGYNRSNGHNNHHDMNDDDASDARSATSSTFFTEEHQQEKLSSILVINANNKNDKKTKNNDNTSRRNDSLLLPPGVTTIRVVAPATLDEGYCFDVIVDEKPYTVTVPLGGIFEGEQFDVPYYKKNNENTIATTTTININTKAVPIEEEDEEDYDVEPTIQMSSSFQTSEPGGNQYYNVDNVSLPSVGIVKHLKNELERKSLENNNMNNSKHSTKNSNNNNGTSNKNNSNNNTVTFKESSSSSLHHSHKGEKYEEEEYDDEYMTDIETGKDKQNKTRKVNKDLKKSHSGNTHIGLSSTKTNSYDDDDDDEDMSIANQTSMTSAPIYGQWRTGLCDCCNVITQATFWMSIFCIPVMIAQLVTRMKLSYKGIRPTINEKYQTKNDINTELSLSYNKIVFSFIIVLIVCNILPGIGLFIIGTIYFFILLVYVGKNLRSSVRRHYQIPSQSLLYYIYYFCCCCSTPPKGRKLKGSNLHKKRKSNNSNRKNSTTSTTEMDNDDNYVEGSGIIEDYCCIVCCSCCTLIQIARHTHNDKEYPGYCCTTTGLELGAPSIV